MSEESAVLHFSTDGIATVTLNRPEVHNAFDEELIERLGDIFEDLGHQEGVRAVVVAAAGKSYCAGAERNWMTRADGFTEEDNRDTALALGRNIKN